MWISVIIICIYFSFVLDLLVLPIPSEASTVSIISSEKAFFSLKSLRSLFGLLISLLFYLSPLFISILFLLNSNIEIMPFHIVVTGVFIAILGRVISVKGTITLRKNYGKSLVESAIFKLSRNPITIGMHLTIFGLLLCFKFWLLWIIFPLYLWIFHGKIIMEETFLESKYGNEYLRYKEKTPRYLW